MANVVKIFRVMGVEKPISDFEPVPKGHLVPILGQLADHGTHLSRFLRLVRAWVPGQILAI